MAEILRFILTVAGPVIVVLALLAWWVVRMNTPPDMRWPRKKQGRRRSERDLPPHENKLDP